MIMNANERSGTDPAETAFIRNAAMQACGSK